MAAIRKLRRRQWHPTPVLLPGKSHGWSLVGCSPWGRKESDKTERLHFTSLPHSIHRLGFPGGASGKEPACQCRRSKRQGFDPWVGKIPCWRAWQPTPVFLPGKSQGQRSLVGHSPKGCKESDTSEAI